MKNNWLDHVGHSRGYYTDDYWGEVKELDESQKAAEEKRIRLKLPQQLPIKLHINPLTIK